MSRFWKEIPGFDGKYSISKDGKIRSLYSRWGKRKNPMELSVWQQDKGYKCVKLTRNNGSKKYYIHKLLAQAFIPNPENKPCVNHKDGDPTNNKLSNLEWATYSEDQKHAHKSGLNNKDYATGQNNNLSKLTENEVLEIRAAHKLDCFNYTEMADAYDVSDVTIRNIIKRKTWKHI